MKLKSLALVFSLTLPILANALAQAPKSGSLPAIPTPDGAIIRWYLPNGILPKNGFKVYRKTAGNEENFKVASPQPKETVVNAGWMDEKAFAGLVEYYSKPVAAGDEDAQFQKLGMDLQVLKNPNWARALGMMYTDKGLKPATTYNYHVVALDGTREIEIGKTTITTGTTPAVPTLGKISSEAIPGKIELSWKSAPVENDLVIAYHIYRGENNGALEVLPPDPYFPRGIDDKGNRMSVVSVVDRNVKLSKVYRYAISSLDIFGRESAKSEIVTIDMNAVKPLASLPIGNLKSGNKNVQLKWAKILDARVTTVLVLRGLSPSKPFEVLAKVPATTTSYTDEAVKPATNYYYALQLQTATGTTSGKGPMQTVRVLNTTAPKAPTGLKLVSKKDGLEISWKANIESDLDGYMVMRAESDKTDLEDYVTLTADPILETQFVDPISKGVNTKYVYRVVAVNTSNVASVASELVRGAILDTTPPNAPLLVDASGLEAAIGLAWNQAATPDLDHYEIFRITGNEKPVLVANVSATSVGYIDRTVLPNLTYTYVVTAVDNSGNRSEISNTQSARAFLTKAPNAPTGLKASRSKDGIKLEWNKLDAPVFYIVYRLGTDGKATQISAPLEMNSFVDKDGKPGMRYAIKAIDLSGNLSTLTEIVSVK